MVLYVTGLLCCVCVPSNYSNRMPVNQIINCIDWLIVGLCGDFTGIGGLPDEICAICKLFMRQLEIFKDQSSQK